jgi:hypothetical protein
MLKRLGKVFLWLGVVLSASMIFVALMAYSDEGSSWQLWIGMSAFYLILGIFFWFLLTRLGRLFKPKASHGQISYLLGQVTFWLGIGVGFASIVFGIFLPLYANDAERIKHLIITFIFWYFIGWILRYIINGRIKWYP